MIPEVESQGVEDVGPVQEVWEGSMEPTDMVSNSIALTVGWLVTSASLCLAKFQMSISR